MTKTQLVNDIAARLEGTKKVEIKAFIEAFKDSAIASLAATGVFAIPDVVKLVVVTSPARPARQGRNPKTGLPLTIAAKPVSKKLKARFPKSIKAEVGQIAKVAKAPKAPRPAKAPRVAQPKPAKAVSKSTKDITV